MKPIGLDKVMEQKRVINKSLKKMFANRIKQNFLIEIKEKVMFQLGDSVEEYFDLSFDIDNAVSGIHDSAVDFEICRMIVGCHRANTIFLDEAKRSALQQDETYKRKLIGQVIEEIKLRPYAGVFFRKEQIIPGDEFLFFPVLYKLFAIAINASSLIEPDLPKAELYTIIINKAIAAMTMIENNFMDSAYPLVRTVIEVFVKQIFASAPIVLNEIKLFTDWEFDRVINDEYPKEFMERYEQRINQSQKSKVDYLHYGWVDLLDSAYHDIVKIKPYSIYGLFSYIKKICGKDVLVVYEMLENIYSACHAFTHGSIGNEGFPLIHYFELTIGLYIPVTMLYEQLCNETGQDTAIEDIDIIKTIFVDFEKLTEQHKSCTDEGLEEYYKRLFNVN